jgi:hypothetical protein
MPIIINIMQVSDHHLYFRSICHISWTSVSPLLVNRWIVCCVLDHTGCVHASSLWWTYQHCLDLHQMQDATLSSGSDLWVEGQNRLQDRPYHQVVGAEALCWLRRKASLKEPETCDNCFTERYTVVVNVYIYFSPIFPLVYKSVLLLGLCPYPLYSPTLLSSHHSHS